MKEKIKELSLLLLYLTSWEEEEFSETFRRSWKGYPFEVLDELREEGLIFGSNTPRRKRFKRCNKVPDSLRVNYVERSARPSHVGNARNVSDISSR